MFFSIPANPIAISSLLCNKKRNKFSLKFFSLIRLVNCLSILGILVSSTSKGLTLFLKRLILSLISFSLASIFNLILFSNLISCFSYFLYIGFSLVPNLSVRCISEIIALYSLTKVFKSLGSNSEIGKKFTLFSSITNSVRSSFINPLFNSS